MIADCATFFSCKMASHSTEVIDLTADTTDEEASDAKKYVVAVFMQCTYKPF